MFPNFLHFFAFFWRTTGLHQTLIFVHAVAFCSQLQSFTNFSVFGTFLRNYWSDFDQTLIFVYAVRTLQPIVKFQNFLTFLHFSEELLVFIKLWFLFMLWHSAANCKVSQISFSFWHFSLETTDLILIKLSFLFMLCHSAANCKVSKFSHFFAFSEELLVFIKHWFLFMLLHSTASCKVSQISHFFALFLGTIGWSW